MKPKKINVLALWLPMKDKGLSIKSFNEGYSYLENNLIMHSTLTSPVIRYAKNYSTENKNYSLCLITQDKNTKKVEKWLDEQAKKVKEKDVEDKFKLLDINYE